MLTRSYCCFCEKQIDDKYEVVQHSVTNAVAHKICAKAKDVTLCESASCTEKEEAHQCLEAMKRATEKEENNDHS